jgi:hypothetical protein
MKKNCILVFSIFFFTIISSKALAQQIISKTNSIERIVLKITEVENISIETIDTSIFRHFFLEKSYAISQLTEEKMNSNRDNFKELKYKNQQQKEDLIRRINEQKNINILDFEIEILENQNNTYIIDEKLGFILVIYSAKRIIQDFNEFKTTKK